MTDRKQLARCTGVCCTVIPLFSKAQGQLTPVALAAVVKAESGYEDDKAVDTRKVASMLIPFEGPWPVPRDDPMEEDRRLYTDWKQGPVFACKHFDGHDCGIYDDRPDLCRRYGVSGSAVCMFEECEMRLDKDDPLAEMDKAPLLSAESLVKA